MVSFFAKVSAGHKPRDLHKLYIDDCWAVKPGASDGNLAGEPRDAQGKVNANARFPDMKALTDFIHAKGLKAGIYTSPRPAHLRGTCRGLRPRGIRRSGSPNGDLIF